MTDQALHSKAFNQAIEEDVLIGSHCLACGHISIPQRQICPKCHSDQAERIQTNGKGTLAAFTVIYVPPTSMADAGYNAKNPYCVGIVAFGEGPRISAQIVGLDLGDPSSIKIGMPLKQTFVVRGEGEAAKKFLAFEPAQEI
ncbi:MAG TPA: Zn-ribbon domain-containing OB-fold protein [Anaerolineaceae bacterium]|nr:Zn-ribbon domain-containing OB-fold protein [Anaerolineaceae bacterium]